MSVQSSEDERGASARGAARLIDALAALAHKIADEVVYMLREDLRHGQMSRDPKDWERWAHQKSPSNLDNS